MIFKFYFNEPSKARQLRKTLAKTNFCQDKKSATSKLQNTTNYLLVEKVSILLVPSHSLTAVPKYDHSLIMLTIYIMLIYII